MFWYVMDELNIVREQWPAEPLRNSCQTCQFG
jgi:hypothetical protein